MSVPPKINLGLLDLFICSSFQCTLIKKKIYFLRFSSLFISLIGILVWVTESRFLGLPQLAIDLRLQICWSKSSRLGDPSRPSPMFSLCGCSSVSFINTTCNQQADIYCSDWGYTILFWSYLDSVLCLLRCTLHWKPTPWMTLSILAAHFHVPDYSPDV